MALPAQIAVSFDFSSGAQFGFPFVVGDTKYGIIGTSQLGSSSVPIPIVDLTPNVTQITISRGRNTLQDTYEAGTCSIRVLDPDGAWNPQNVNSPYYPYLVPLRKIRVSATTGTDQHFLFSGYSTEYFYTYDQSENMGYVTIMASDAFRLFQQSQVSTVTDSGAGQSTGTRMAKLLNQVGFPTNMRTLATGDSNCSADPGTTRTLLGALKNVEFAEQGAAYVDGSGTFVFKDRSDVISSIAGTPIEFNQTTGIPYKNLALAFNDKLIMNQATITRVGSSSPQFAENTASAIRYFPHAYTTDNIVIDTDANALNIARTFVATRAETTIRIDAMTVDLLDPSVPTNTMIGLDYFDNCKITNVQPDGSTIIKTLQVQGLNWVITPNSMQVTVTTLEQLTNGFVLSSPVSGIIGESAMTY